MMVMLNFTSEEWRIHDEENRLKMEEDKITWSKLKRSQNTSISKEAYFENFTLSFYVKVTSVITYLRSDRLMISLWKLKKSNGNIVSVYIDKTRDYDNKYRLVFYQRVNGNNKFVSVSPYLELNYNYCVTVVKNEDKFHMNVFWEESLVFESEELTGVNHYYNEIIFAQSHGFIIEPNDESSGILSNIKISDEVAEKEEELINPIEIYNKIITHPRIIKVSSGLFGDGYYDDSVLKAYIEIERMIKEKTYYPEKAGKKSIGSALMHDVFGGISPTLKLNSLITDSEINEQKGFCKIFAGAMEGIRNPHAHDNIEMEPIEAVRLLGLANVLAEKVDQAEYTG